MDDEPSLPQLGNLQSSNSIANNPARKRVRHSSFTTISSDPALFSSDDDPSADNYLRERRKKKFRGPWYRQVLQSETGSQDSIDHEPAPKKSERKFERRYDSGVFLGSDATELDEGLELAPHEVRAPMLPLRQAWTNSQPARSPAEVWAQGQIQQCLEDGNESIDLSGRGISTISNATIRPLATLTLVPPVSQSTNVFFRLEPDLKIFLSTNDLNTLPEELFQLERLTTLSLRGNTLREIPPAIANLTNLVELNVSLNILGYLPFEILDLFSDTAHLRSFSIHPNPFLQPELRQRAIWHERKQVGHSTPSERRSVKREGPSRAVQSWSSRWKLSFYARSDVRYFDKNEVLVQGPIFDIDVAHQAATPMADLTIDPSPPAPTGAFTSRAPSLVEAALQSCLLAPQTSQLSSLLPPDAPQHIHDLLDKATAQKESGVGTCTICNRRFVVKRTEWIEWWEIDPAQEENGSGVPRHLESERDIFESKVPLIRRGCSWLCVPERIEIVVEEGDVEMGEGTI